MTEEGRRVKIRMRSVTAARALLSGKALFGGMGIFLLAVILRNASVAAKWVSSGLRLCADTVIPSLFPFMVISEIIISSNGARLLPKALLRPIGKLLGFCDEAVSASVLGLVCGFPIGTRCALSLYERGVIEKGELSRLLAFSNVPSMGFIMSTVGASLFGDRRYGTALYAITLLSSVLTALLSRYAFVKEDGESRSERSQNEREERREVKAKKSSAVAIFTDSIGSSALAMLKICAFVTFFFAFVGTLEYALAGLELSYTLKSLVFGLFELTGGVARAADCDMRVGRYLCAFMVGWSGLSVHFQLISLCADTDVAFLPYFFRKLLQGALNVCLLAIYYGVLRL